MSKPISVKINSPYQITLPTHARHTLDIQPGDRLLLDIQDGLIILMPKPDNYVDHMAGLYQEMWQGIETEKYLKEERKAWLKSNEI